MPSPFVDTHVHLWDLEHPKLRYIWLGPGASHPQLSSEELVELGAASQTLERFLAETEGSGMSKWIHVEAAIGTVDPVDETAWLQELAEQPGGPSAIIGAAALRDADIVEQLDRHGEHSAFRGVRDQTPADAWEEPAFEHGYAELGRRGLVCSINAFWDEMPRAAALAERLPETTLVLDHMGFPQERSEVYFDQWRAGMHRLAEAESVICKISEVGIMEPGWTTDSIRRWVLGCIEAFGVERCVLGTNWPVDRLYGTYDEIVDAYRTIIAELSEAEQRALLSDNAERIYRI